MYSEQEYVTELMQLGADGYLCKDTLDAELFKGLRAVASGERYLSEREARSLLNGVLAEKRIRRPCRNGSRKFSSPWSTAIRCRRLVIRCTFR